MSQNHGPIANNALFSTTLHAARTQTAEDRKKSILDLFDLLNTHKVTALSLADIQTAIVLSNEMGTEVDGQTSLDLLQLIFNIAAVKVVIAENAIDIIHSIIEMNDPATLDLLRELPEIEDALAKNETDFVNTAEYYGFDEITQWISSRNQSKNRPQ